SGLWCSSLVESSLAESRDPDLVILCFRAEKKQRNTKRKKSQLTRCYTQVAMGRPFILVSAGEALFDSFFAGQQRRLNQLFRCKRVGDREVSAELKKQLAQADGLVTTWDSPRFGDELLALAPRLRAIAHCGGEVKSRFSPKLFNRLTITNA